MILKNYIDSVQCNMGSRFLNDKTLTMRDKGVLATLFILHPSNKITYTGLATFHTDKESAIKTSLKRLQEKGYIMYRLITDIGVTKKIQMVIYDEPHNVDLVNLDKLFTGESSKSIIKNRKDKPYLTIGKSPFYNHQISFKALGLLLMLYSRNIESNTSIRILTTQVKDRKDAIREAFVELEKAGYVIRSQDNNQGRWSGGSCVIFDFAQPQAKIAVNGNNVTKKPITVKSTQNKQYNITNNQYNRRTTKKNSFCNFEQRHYDADEYEKLLLTTSLQ